jgi:ubiquinone/menaquinone biosynthesis C-methylase UbiE
MRTKIINSEDPKIHWSDITDVTGRVVLDLGCGWVGEGSTPGYFLERGAAKVIGVDATQSDVDKLKGRYPDQTFICRVVCDAPDLQRLLDDHNPDVIKMDIEGWEIVLDKINDLKNVTEVAIEYHDFNCKSIVIKKLSEWGFDIFAVNSFGYHCTDTKIMGVIHARK